MQYYFLLGKVQIHKTSLKYSNEVEILILVYYIYYILVIFHHWIFSHLACTLAQCEEYNEHSKNKDVASHFTLFISTVIMASAISVISKVICI